MQTLSLVDVLIENMQLRIHNVHVRIEDSVSGDHQFAFGLTLDRLTMVTTNEKWTQTFALCMSTVHTCVWM